MLPSRGAFLLAFGSVVLAGILGGIIGYGIADVSSQSDVSHLLGTFVGSVIGAGGVGSAAVPIAIRRDFFEHLVVADYDAARATTVAERG